MRRLEPRRQGRDLAAVMDAYYADHFVLPLPEGHRFPMAKYARLRERVARDLPQVRLRVPRAASDGELRHVHTEPYLQGLAAGTLDPLAIRRIGFPWSPAMVQRARRSVGGTIGALRSALREGVAANLAGGTHHAYPDGGEGFCVFNDVAVAIRVAQAEGTIRRAVVLDCDVHQGNGTAAIFRDDASVFTFSVHGARNYPFRKETSDLDIALEDGAGDAAYLEAVACGVDTALASGAADVACYIAGADPFAEDRLGRLRVSKQGLAERDHLVLSACRARGVPVAVVMGGGYARDVADIVDIHFASIRAAAHHARPATSTIR
jgi:acetoin utilization deacetylase AcuC-like enzyme